MGFEIGTKKMVKWVVPTNGSIDGALPFWFNFSISSFSLLSIHFLLFFFFNFFWFKFVFFFSLTYNNTEVRVKLNLSRIMTRLLPLCLNYFDYFIGLLDMSLFCYTELGFGEEGYGSASNYWVNLTIITYFSQLFNFIIMFKIEGFFNFS